MHGHGRDGAGVQAAAEFESDPVGAQAVADVVAVRVVDPLEEELPAVGPIAMHSAEDGLVYEVDGRSARVREQWAQA